MAVRKDSTEMDVEQKLKKLYELQTQLSEIDNIKAERGQLPLEVQDIEDEIEGLTTRIERNTQEVERLQKAIADYRRELTEAQERVARYTEQINTISNSREYDTLQKEVEYQNLEIQLRNKRIREAEEKIRELEARMDETRNQLDNRRTDLEIKKGELEEIIAETRNKEEYHREKAKNLELSIEARLLMSFKRIRRSSRNGLGIVYIQRDACGGCFNKIPPQRQLDIRMHKKVIVCEYCGRIMIDPELAGVKIEKPKEKTTTRRTSRKKTEE